MEGFELAVLQGMQRTIAEVEPWIVCEVLHRDRLVSADQHQMRLDRLQAFLNDLDYAVLRVGTSRGDAVEIGAVDAFPNEVYTTADGAECDYLFVPGRDIEAAQHLAG